MSFLQSQQFFHRLTIRQTHRLTNKVNYRSSQPELNFGFNYWPVNKICLKVGNGEGALRVFVVSDDAETKFPVLVVVRHEKGVLSWQLPMLVQVKF